MQPPEVDNLIASIDQAYDAFADEVSRIILSITTGGTVQFTTENLNAIAQAYPNFVTQLRGLGMDSFKADLFASEARTITAFKKFKVDGFVPFKLSAAKDIPLIKSLQASELLEVLALEQETANAVYNTLVSSVTQGQQSYDAIKSLEKAVETQKRYTKTWYNTSRQIYEQKLQDLSAKNYQDEFGGDLFWEYIGAPKDDKIRYECSMAVDKRVFTNAEKEAFESGQMFDAGVPRYNCRHTFWQITERRYREMTQ